MQDKVKYMRRAATLAQMALGETSPNPMVGAVVVNSSGKIIGEGYHHRAGEAHAEVNAIDAVVDKSELKDSTIYVTLEPCCHYGKTPPCTKKIIEAGIPRVVIGTLDPFAKVAGKGVQILQENGIEVEVDVEQELCCEVNRRFFTTHTKNRPYVILKWAQTKDGFIDIKRDKYIKPQWFTSPESKALVHTWRTEEDAIMVGRVTAEKDNPSLTVREAVGRNPKRVVISRNGVIFNELNLFNSEATTLVITAQNASFPNAKTIVLEEDNFTPLSILECLKKENILSVIIEGGAQLLESFLKADLWDEARIFTAQKPLKEYYDLAEIIGIPAPTIEIPKREDCHQTQELEQYQKRVQRCVIGGDSLLLLRR